LNLDDASVPDLLKVYTLLDKTEIDRLTATITENPGAREAQKALARDVTTIVHGQERLQSVERVTDVLFGRADFQSLAPEDIDMLAREISVVPVGTSLIEALVSTGLATSNGEAKRLIESGAVSVNAEKVSNDKIINDVSLVKKGKNSFILVR
jgi:tyrosyl-tRNA synthetase